MFGKIELPVGRREDICKLDRNEPYSYQQDNKKRKRKDRGKYTVNKLLTGPLKGDTKTKFNTKKAQLSRYQPKLVYLLSVAVEYFPLLEVH